MHGVPSSYYDFRDSLGKRSALRETLETYLTPTDLWADFEDSLAHINAAAMLSVVPEWLEDFDAFDSDATMASLFVACEAATAPTSTILEKLTHRFRLWIESLQPASSDKPLESLLHKDSRYLCFNYTDFLESIYGISESQIFYIHGCRKNKKQELVLGHAPDADADDPAYDPDMPAYKSRRKRELLQAAVDIAGDHLAEYNHQTSKKTAEIINCNRDYFRSLTDITSIVVIGHSLSPVDYPYFREIANRSSHPATWYISWHTANDLAHAKQFAAAVGLDAQQSYLFRT